MAQRSAAWAWQQHGRACGREEQGEVEAESLLRQAKALQQPPSAR
jgi:hypothetical protein